MSIRRFRHNHGMTATTTQQLKFAGASDALVTYLTAAETAGGTQDTAIATLVAAVAHGTAATTYLTVRTGAPTTTFITPIVYDDTAVTGGLYVWAGSAYTKVAGLAP